MAGQSLLILVSALLLGISFIGNAWSILILVALAPAFFALQHPHISIKQSFRLGWVLGTLFLGYFHSWLLPLHHWVGWWIIIATWIAFSAYLGLVWGLMFGLIRMSRSYMPIWISGPLVWIAGEWVSSIIPFGNQGGHLGYALIDLPWLVQPASIGGVALLTGFIGLINGCVSMAVARRNGWAMGGAIALVCVWALWGLGIARFNSLHTPWGPPIPVAIIQGNQAQHEKQDASTWLPTWQYYLTQTRAEQSRKTELVFWPETVIPVPILSVPLFSTQLYTLVHQTQLGLVGGLPRKTDQRYANSIFAIDNQSTPKIQFYDKHILMPFGEYLPLRRQMERIHALKSITSFLDYERGVQLNPLTVHGIKIGPAICLESLRAYPLNRQVQNGATVLFVAANNAWFGSSSAAQRHFSMSRMRAVENHRYLIQAANTGISGIVDPTGRVLNQTELNKQTTLQGSIRTTSKQTIFTRLSVCLPMNI